MIIPMANFNTLAMNDRKGKGGPPPWKQDIWNQPTLQLDTILKVFPVNILYQNNMQLTLIIHPRKCLLVKFAMKVINKKSSTTNISLPTATEINHSMLGCR